MAYPKHVKESILSMLYSPNAPSLRELSRRHGVPKATIQSWIQSEELKTAALKNSAHKGNYWPPHEKLEAILKSMSVSEEEFGTYLRENGLYSSLVTQWKEDMLRTLAGAPKHQFKTDPPTTEVKALRRELRDKEKALAELSAIIILKKKAALILGEEDEKPTPNSE